MDNENKKQRLNRLIGWKTLVPLVFTYGLGISPYHYLGGRLDFINVLLGLLLCVLIFEMGNFLSAYFDHPESYQSTLDKNDPYHDYLLKIKRPLLLQYSLLILTAGAMVTFILIARKSITGTTLVLLGTALVIYFFSASPPFYLARNGYKELVEAIFISNLVPSIAFTLQKMEISILLIELTLPLTLVYLAMKIAFAMRDFGFDTMHGRQSLVTRMGWQKAVMVHNVMILLAFLLRGAFMFMGLSWALTWPVFLALPLGGMQVFQMLRIAEGDKPRWTLLSWLAAGLFLLMVYMEAISLWL